MKQIEKWKLECLHHRTRSVLVLPERREERVEVTFTSPESDFYAMILNELVKGWETYSANPSSDNSSVSSAKIHTLILYLRQFCDRFFLLKGAQFSQQSIQQLGYCLNCGKSKAILHTCGHYVCPLYDTCMKNLYNGSNSEDLQTAFCQMCSVPEVIRTVSVSPYTDSAKTAKLKELLQRELRKAPTRKFLVFSQWTGKKS